MAAERVAHGFHRGALALDFAGTLGRRAAAQPEERLPDARELGRWLVEAGLVRARPPVDPASFADARALREAIARAALAAAAGTAPRAADVRALNAAAAWTRLGAAHLDPHTLAERRATAEPVRDALGRIAADAIRMLAHERDRLTRCALEECGALLLSRSRGEVRRWCSMETCGNRAKVAAHRRRKAGP